MTLTHILVDFDNVKPSAADIGLAHADNLRLAIVRGAQPTRYEADLAEALHRLAERVTFTRCAKSGKNAADMQIAFHLGELVGTLPPHARKSTRFVVISKDRDFDALLTYLQSQGVDATRAPSFKAALGQAEVAIKPRSAARPARPAAAKAPAARSAAKKAAAKKTPAARPVAAKKPAPATDRPAAKKSLDTDRPTRKPADPIARIIEGLQRKGDERPGKRKGLERFVESHLGRNLAPGQLDALLAQLQSDGVLVFRENKVDYHLPKAVKHKG